MPKTERGRGCTDLGNDEHFSLMLGVWDAGAGQGRAGGSE